jgi:putative phosphoribosyl transferase
MSRGESALRAARPVQVSTGRNILAGDLTVPSEANALVIFAHGSGSSRFSPRNRYVADTLYQRGFATLLIDLLTVQEEEIDEHSGRYRFDIRMLADRLIDLCRWAHGEPALHALQIGLFGASTGGGAALLAAAQEPSGFHAVVSRGGRPDLAGPALSRVMAPTLLIVGEHDETVLELNQRAMEQMHGEVRLEIVPRATHLFEEAGALERVAQLASDWFGSHLARRTR